MMITTIAITIVLITGILYVSAIAVTPPGGKLFGWSPKQAEKYWLKKLSKEKDPRKRKEISAIIDKLREIKDV